ncbi:MAG: TIGR00341 family protein [Desulfobulbaceae bacterium]
MALRLLEMNVPEEHVIDVLNILEENRIVNFWQTCGCESSTIIKVILPIEETEHLLTLVETRYSHLPEFRATLTTLEASIPSLKKLDEESGKNGAAQDADTKGAETPLRISRQELYNEVFYNSKLTKEFMVMVFLSTVVAAIGLLRDNTAVIIGAMVIAPLLGPNVAFSLAATLGDIDLGRNAFKTSFSGILFSFVVSVVLGVLLTIDPATPEIHARTIVSPADIVLALASGAAGAMAFTGGMSAALIGVMVAVALVPPLVTSGLLLGAGYFLASIDAIMLLAINTICINLAGIATFLAQGIQPAHWWEAKKAKKMTYKAVALWITLLLVLLVMILAHAPGS